MTMCQPARPEEVKSWSGVGVGRSRMAAAALKIAVSGLQRRAVHNSKGADESRFLDPLIEFTEADQTPAERKLALFHGQGKGDIDHVFREFAY
jgi:glutamate--cysteine ligase